MMCKKATSFNKLIEKLVKTRILSLLKSSNILSDTQFGFEEKISTTDAII